MREAASFLLRLGLLAGVGAGLGLWARPAPPEPEPVPILPDGRPLSGRLRVEELPSNPALRAELPWANGASLYGWGSVRLSARPREDELTVRIIVDAPARSRRWAGECDVRLKGEGGTVVRHARYVGRPMDGGASYDAIRIELPIEEVRRLAATSTLHGTVCGDSLALREEQLDTLRAFVSEFDDLATENRPSRATEALRAPEDPLLEEEEILEDAS
jgi:hypothetical protein